ncbi:unnamed protein product [Heterobilharzia americana]|nr:unnamed protein product [Heterobilharzia americana]
MAAKRKGAKKVVEEQISLGPQVAEGEFVFGVCHIYASFNDTFVHVTDATGAETIVRVTGGMKVKADRDESSPYAAMLAAQDVAEKCKSLGINALHIRIRATGGTKVRTPSPAAQSALRASPVLGCASVVSKMSLLFQQTAHDAREEEEVDVCNL